MVTGIFKIFSMLGGLKGIFIWTSIIVIAYPIVVAFFSSGFSGALIEFGHQVFLPDLKINQEMKILINNDSLSFFDRVNIIIGTLAGLATLWFIGLGFYKLNHVTGEIVAVKGFLISLAILYFIEWGYIAAYKPQDLGYAFEGLVNLITHFGQFLQVIFPFAKFLDKIDIVDPKNYL